jgi:uncharacterized membrane protein YuzA (DUF378 family)
MYLIGMLVSIVGLLAFALIGLMPSSKTILVTVAPFVLCGIAIWMIFKYFKNKSRQKTLGYWEDLGRFSKRRHTGLQGKVENFTEYIGGGLCFLALSVLITTRTYYDWPDEALIHLIVPISFVIGMLVMLFTTFLPND